MRLSCVLLGLVFLGVTGVSAQERRLQIRVEDPSGATIPNASIIVLAGSDVLSDLTADARGLATVNIQQHATVKLIVTAPGFATTETEVTVPPKVVNHPVTVSLPLANIETDVTVSATQDETGGLTETLSQEEIDQLPDDEEELRRMLEEIAGPGATIRVDGFSGGRLPTRDQIARIVVRRDAFSAEFHQVGQGRVEIATRPGVDRWRGNAGLTLRPTGLSARNAVARAKGGTMLRMNGNVAGPLVRNRISFSANIEGSSSEDTRGISAITPTGQYFATVTQPFDSRDVSVRTEGLLTQRTMFRLSYSRGKNERDNQGISELDLPERGYRSESVDHELRFSLEGGQRRPYHLRLQMDQSTSSAVPDTIAPAIVVQSSFRSGGATLTGDNRNRTFLADTMFTLKARPYTLRVGSLITYDRNDTGQLRNSLGTFTFTDIDSYLLGLPATFTQRVGAQPLGFGIGQGATFIQAEFTRARWNIGLGARHEWQTGISDWTALAPRFGLSRAFGRNNRTNFRAGYGWFYGWMPSRIEEETIRLAQGSTEQEVIISNPSYPDPFGAGTLTTRREPPTRLNLSDDAELPRWQRVSVGIDHQIRQGWRLNFDTFYENSTNDFRAIDLNAPIDGVRPDPAFGRVLLVQSIGRARRTGFNVDMNFSPRQGMFSSIRYGYSRNMNDSDDQLTPPPYGTFDTEWAAARGDQRHRVNWNIGGQLFWGISANLNGRFNSGGTYNLTTGRDDNRDAIFNDRPAGVGRNTLRGSYTTQTDLRLSWTLPQFRPNGSAIVNLQRGPGGGGGGQRPGGPGGRGPGGQQAQRRFEMYLFVTNLLNRVNRTGYVGQQNSILFGQPTSAQAARRVEMGWRFSF
jgi:hypothetical protein